MKRFRHEYDKELLKPRIQALWEANTPQAEMVRVLNEEGHDVGSSAVTRIRTENGWALRDDDRSISKRDSAPSASFVNATPSVKKQPGWKRTPESKALRFPSQISGSEAKRRLGLDTTTYRALRTQFERICQERGIDRKSATDPAAWQAAKEDLITCVPGLYNILRTHADADYRRVQEAALEVICIDVTKIVRSRSRVLSASAARTVLGVNPNECRQMIETLQLIIDASGMPFLSDMTADQKRSLEDEWARQSPIACQMLERRPVQQDRSTEWSKAYNAILGTAFSRYRDKTRAVQQPEEESQSAAVPKKPKKSATAQRKQRGQTRQAALPLQDDEAIQEQLEQEQLAQETDLAYDSFLPDLNSGLHPPSSPAPVPPPPTSYAAYLRLHPSSSFTSASSLWIATVTSASIGEIQGVAAAKFPGTVCLMVEGIVKDGHGGEVPLQISDNDELAAYLAHIQGTPPTFSVQLVWQTT